MAFIGVLFALDEEQTAALRATDRAARPTFIRDELEDVFWYDRKEDMAELDMAWNAMHRLLTNGKLEFGNDCAPLSGMIMGGEALYGDREGEDAYIITWKSPELVREIAAAADAVTITDFREKYFALDPEEYNLTPYQEDFEYTWAYFRRSLPFWRHAAAEGKAVLFTADR